MRRETDSTTHFETHTRSVLEQIKEEIKDAFPPWVGDYILLRRDWIDRHDVRGNIIPEEVMHELIKEAKEIIVIEEF